MKIKEKLLLEELSVSREVESAVDRLKNMISKEYRKSYREEFSSNLSLYSGALDFEAFGIKFKVEYDVYLVADLDGLTRKDYKLASNNYSNIDENTMSVTLFIYKGVFLSMSDDNIAHEMLHFYQWAKKKEKYTSANELTTKLYQMAVAVIQNKSLDGSETVDYSECEKIIAWLIYFSDCREQDAYINGYYAEMRGNKEQNKTPDLVLAMKNFSEYQNDFSERCETSEMNKALKLFAENGLSFKTLINMVNNANERWEKKKQRVDWLLKTEKNGMKDNVRKQISEEALFRTYIKRLVEQTLKEHKLI